MMCHRNKTKSTEQCNQLSIRIDHCKMTHRPIKSLTMQQTSASSSPNGCKLFHISLALLALVSCNCLAYEFPIHQNLPHSYHSNRIHSQQRQQHQQQHQQLVQSQEQQVPLINERHYASVQSERRSEEPTSEQQQAQDNSEAQRIQHLHQVVDSVAQLLNQEEEQRQQRHQRNIHQSERAVADLPPAELMSEAAIRQAIEELERVQMQERQSVAESRPSPAVVVAGTDEGDLQVTSVASSSAANPPSKPTRSAIESLIDELGDELIDDQLAAASQEAERLMQSSSNDNQKVSAAESRRSEQRAKAEAASLVYGSTLAPLESVKRQQQAATQASEPGTRNTQPAKGILGQLDSELGSALTNDFYSFHAEPIGSNKAVADAQVEPAQANGASSAAASQQNNQQDLDSAAQTRNAVSQRETRQSNQFDQGDGSNLRFDFSQPQPQAQPQPQPQLPQRPDQEALVRAFRQQTGAAIQDEGLDQFPGSTLIPVASSDGFWRPSQPNGPPPQRGDEHGPVDDINQQYNRAHSNQQPGIPILPASRFQSLTSPAPPQSQRGQQQAPVGQHIHFTGHSFESGAGRVAQASNSNNNNNRASTNTPLISVLSGVDTASGSGSVSWNPPPTINGIPSQSPPPQQLFSQPFASSTAQPGGSGQLNVGSPFLPGPQGPASPLFRGAFPGAPETGAQQFQRANANNQFAASTEANLGGDVTTEDRFPPTTTQWSPAASTTPPTGPSSTEREVSDSQPRGSVRALPNGQRFFSPNDLVGGQSPTTSTLPSTTSDAARRNNFPVETTTAAFTATTPAQPAPGTNTTAKKDDMVIYYYYYYDDNKNATVVAKNITTGMPTGVNGPMSLDAAIEADAGIEDTPYMDDPAPLSDIRSQPVRPQPVSSTTTSTTTTSTTSPSKPSLAPFNSFEGSSNDDRRPDGRLSTTSQRTPLAQSDFRAPLGNANFGPSPIQNDQPRLPAAPLAASGRPLARPQQPQQPAFTPSPQPQSSTFRTNQGNRAQETARFVSSTEFPAPRASPVPAQLPPTAPNTRLQNQVIQNALGGAARQASSTASTPVAPSRVPLSNASRYGTNTNNLLLDPTFGMDPSGPTSDPSAVVGGHHHGHHHAGYSHHGPAPGQNQAQQIPKNTWTGTQPATVQQPRRPTPVADPPAAGSNSGSFSSQRSQATLPQPAPPAQPVQRQPPAQSQEPRPISGTVTQSSRQFFPEASNENQRAPVEQPALVNRQPVERQPTRQQFQQPAPRVQPTSTTAATQPARQTTFAAPTPSEFSRTASTFPGEEDLGEDQPRGAVRGAGQPPMGNNGRPSTPEGNTGNGFTRSPLQATSVRITQAPTRVSQPVNREDQFERPQPVSQPASTQAAVSTPRQIASSQATSSMSPPVSSSTTSQSFTSSTQAQPSSTTTTTTTSVPTSSAQPQQPSSVSQTTPASSTSASAASSSGTEAGGTSTTVAASENTDTSGSTRRRFGNRTNRFQFRLPASSGSTRSSTTTSTTPAPSSTTTRRPLSSTTRKTSRQLFAGRRRLGSPEGQGYSAAAPGPASSQPASNATNSEPTAASAAPAPSRGINRFGSNVASRSRLTTAAPSAAPSGTESSARPSLFGGQRATFKPRLPFLKPSSRPAESVGAAEQTTPPTITMTSSVSSSSSSPISVDQPIGAGPASPSSISAVQMNPASASDKQGAGESSQPEAGESGDDPQPSGGGNSAEETNESDKDSSNNAAPNVTEAPQQASTSAPAGSDRNKPRVRPLFASRQRNSALFGNRRTSNSNATTSTN